MRTLRVACMLAGFLSLALSLPAQTFTTLHSFDLNDGDAPAGALVQATNGSLYGTTYEGGGDCEGTVFKITANGGFTRLRCFDGTDGSRPRGALVQGLVGTSMGRPPVEGPTSVERSSKSPPMAR